MPGLKIQIPDLPEQPGEKRISVLWFFLVFGLAWLAVGLGLVRSYFRLTGPTPSDLHALSLTQVTNVVTKLENPGSTKIGRIWLRTDHGARIRYDASFPYSDEIRHLNPDYGLLLDQTNVVWAVTTGGKVLAARFFQEYHIETKRLDKFFGPFFGIMGLVLVFCSVFFQLQVLAGKPLPKELGTLVTLRVRLLILWGSLIAYLFFYFLVVYPLLASKLGGWSWMLIWLLGAALIANGIVAYFKKHPPRKGGMLK
ncbi:MAG: hypothetical protein C5B50_22660 [Verrucomicrobia bacterium]|nr:MAG: hypothetical protein C5B50_22660 [Verrucomicrobiota bacterium]